jgi:hypothetical protein
MYVMHEFTHFLRVRQKLISAATGCYGPVYVTPGRSIAAIVTHARVRGRDAANVQAIPRRGGASVI